jgi:Helix-turn-helix domain
MSIHVMSRVWECSTQAGGSLLVLLAIADFADDEGLAFPSIGTLARKARLSPRQVQRVLAELVAAGELEIEHGHGRHGSHLYRVTIGTRVGGSTTPRQNVAPDTMSPPCARPCRARVTPVSREGVTPASPEPSLREPPGPTTPRSPRAAPPRQQQGAREEDDEDGTPARIEPAGRGPDPPPPSSMKSEPAVMALAAALYGALGSDLDDLTGALRRRELAIAEQLVAVGATAAEAEAYAREARAQPGRVAPIDVRAFERERLSWKARRGGQSAAGPRRVDRTGQPPGGVQVGALMRDLFGGAA